MARIVVVGSIARDEVIQLAEPLDPGRHLNGISVGIRLGGGGANAAVALAAAGHEVSVLSAVGNDADGCAALAELAAAGVDTSDVVRRSRPTTRSLVLVERSGERTVVNLTRCDEDELPRRLLDRPADAVYVRSRRRDLTHLLAARATNCLVVAHVPPVEPASRPAQVLVASASDLDESFRREPLASARRVAGEPLRWFVMTAGAAGASAISETQQLQISAEEVGSVDTTGAGDAFAAGLVHALVGGQPMSEALALAVRFGTEATRWSASGLPAEAVRRLLQ